MTTLERMYADRDEHYDLVLLCGPSGTPFQLHAAVLATESGYFRTFLSTHIGTSSLRSAESPQRVTETSLAECDPEIFSLVVRCIYTGALDDGDGLGRALEVLALAVFLDCGLCERLATRLIDKKQFCFDPDAAVGVWLASSRLGACGARRLAANHLAASMPRAARARSFLSMQKDDLIGMLASDEFSAYSEAHVAEALCAWCEANNEQCTAIDSRVVRLVWNQPAPRDEPTVRGILVLGAEDTRFRFLTAGHEWIYRPAGSVDDLTSPRGAGAAICSVGRSIFAIGGLRARPVEKHQTDDKAERRPWRPWRPYDYGCMRPHVSCAAVGSLIYVAGGVSGLRPCDEIDILDVDSGLRGATRMSRARRMCIAAESGGSLLVAGGFDSIGSALANAEIVRRFAHSAAAPPMLEPRAAAAHATIGADVYVAGGIGALHEPVRTAEYFDAQTQEWVELPPMPRCRAFCAGAAMGLAFYVLGGTESDRPTNSFFRFDLATSEWSEWPAPALGECAATRSPH